MLITNKIMYHCSTLIKTIKDLLELSNDPELCIFEKLSDIERIIDIKNEEVFSESNYLIIDEIKQFKSKFKTITQNTQYDNSHILTNFLEFLSILEEDFKSIELLDPLTTKRQCHYNNAIEDLVKLKSKINKIEYEYYDYIFKDEQVIYIDNISSLLIIRGFHPENIIVFSSNNESNEKHYLITAMINNHIIAKSIFHSNSNIFILDESSIVTDFIINSIDSTHNQGLSHIILNEQFYGLSDSKLYDDNIIKLHLTLEHRPYKQIDDDLIVYLNRIPKSVKQLTLTKCIIHEPIDLSFLSQLILEDMDITTEVIRLMKLRSLSINSKYYKRIDFTQLITLETLTIVINPKVFIAIDIPSELKMLELIIKDYNACSNIPEKLKSLKLISKHTNDDGISYNYLQSLHLEYLELDRMKINLANIKLPILRDLKLINDDNFNNLIPMISTITNLTLYYCDIKIFNREVLELLPNLKIIDIKDCYIQIDSFSTSLEQITLSIDITDISPYALIDLPNLSNLNIIFQGRYKSYIHECLFNGLSSLKTLSLAQKNIKTFDSNLFKDLINLNILTLKTYNETKIFEGNNCLKDYYLQIPTD